LWFIRYLVWLGGIWQGRKAIPMSSLWKMFCFQPKFSQPHSISWGKNHLPNLWQGWNYQEQSCTAYENCSPYSLNKLLKFLSCLTYFCSGFWNYEESYHTHNSFTSIQKQGNYHCNQCEKRFESAKSLSNHQAVHDGKTTCPVCGKVESTRSNLSMHMKMAHPDFIANI